MSTLFVGFKTDDNPLQVAINQASSRLNHTTAGWVRMLVMRELQQQGLMKDPYGVPAARAPATAANTAKAARDAAVWREETTPKVSKEMEAYINKILADPEKPKS